MKPIHKIQLTEFASKHGIDHRFTQFGHRVRSPYDTLQRLQDGFDDLYKYKQSYQITDVFDVDTYGDMRIVETMLWASGSYKLRDGTKTPIWANPQYAHGVEHQPPAQPREVHIERALNIPTITRNDIADRFGITGKSLSNWLLEHGYDFRGKQTEAKRRIGRSIRTSVEYSDYSLADLCRLIPAPNSTVKTWAQRAYDDGWEAPPYPDDAKFLD